MMHLRYVRLEDHFISYPAILSGTTCTVYSVQVLSHANHLGPGDLNAPDHVYRRRARGPARFIKNMTGYRPPFVAVA